MLGERESWMVEHVTRMCYLASHRTARAHQPVADGRADLEPGPERERTIISGAWWSLLPRRKRRDSPLAAVEEIRPSGGATRPLT